VQRAPVPAWNGCSGRSGVKHRIRVAPALHLALQLRDRRRGPPIRRAVRRTGHRGGLRDRPPRREPVPLPRGALSAVLIPPSITRAEDKERGTEGRSAPGSSSGDITTQGQRPFRGRRWLPSPLPNGTGKGSGNFGGTDRRPASRSAPRRSAATGSLPAQRSGRRARPSGGPGARRGRAPGGRGPSRSTRCLPASRTAGLPPPAGRRRRAPGARCPPAAARLGVGRRRRPRGRRRSAGARSARCRPPVACPARFTPRAPGAPAVCRACRSAPGAIRVRSR
jgi:hypothetical protein